MNILDAAMLIAIEAHGGDRNKHDGEMYTLHLARVAMNVREAGGGQSKQAVAWLHDVLEDTAMTIKDLSIAFADIGMPGTSAGEVVEVITAIDVLTKRKGESNIDYYHRVKTNPIARFVKYHGDMKDNFRRNHQIKDEATRLRMAEKYSLGMDILG